MISERAINYIKNIILITIMVFNLLPMVSIQAEKADIEIENVKSIFISYSANANGMTINLSEDEILKRKYIFFSDNCNVNEYIIHYINSFDLQDDGRIIHGGDIPILNINLTKLDSSIDKYGFVGGRFYDATNKQYAVDRNDYQRFLTLIYALKTKKIVLEDEITSKPSEWAKDIVNRAIEVGLVPKLNQINYTGKITRLEVCHLIENYLHVNNIQSYTDNYVNPQFTDIEDSSITHLWNNRIINGKSETNFCPYDFITREELAKVLSNVYCHMNGNISFKNNNISFQDKNMISDWAIDSVNSMAFLGVLIGDENGNFEPQKNITKEESIVTIFRLFELQLHK